MTIITSQEELEQHLKEAREDIAQGRTYSFEYIKDKFFVKNKEKVICSK